MSKTVIRVSFSEAEMQDVAYLLPMLRKDTVPDLIRALLLLVSQEKREAARKYGGEGGTASVPRETKGEARAERMRALRAMDDTTLTEELRRIGYIVPDATYYDRMIHTDISGARYFRTVGGGVTDDIPIDAMFRDLEKKKLI